MSRLFGYLGTCALLRIRLALVWLLHYERSILASAFGYQFSRLALEDWQRKSKGHRAHHAGHAARRKCSSRTKVLGQYPYYERTKRGQTA